MTEIIAPSMGESAYYSIRVRGRLPASYSDHLEGMCITTHTTSQGSVESVLVGKLRDQAALFGVLNSLYELRLPIVSAQFLDGQ